MSSNNINNVIIEDALRIYTDDQLKAALVRALPEKLKLENPFPEYGTKAEVPMWVGAWKLVTPHEWTTIVGMVEEALEDAMYALFIPQRIEISKTYQTDDITQMRAFDKWQTRAAALVEIGHLKIV